MPDFFTHFNCALILPATILAGLVVAILPRVARRSRAARSLLLLMFIATLLFLAVGLVGIQMLGTEAKLKFHPVGSQIVPSQPSQRSTRPAIATSIVRATVPTTKMVVTPAVTDDPALDKSERAGPDIADKDGRYWMPVFFGTNRLQTPSSSRDWSGLMPALPILGLIGCIALLIRWLRRSQNAVVMPVVIMLRIGWLFSIFVAFLFLVKPLSRDERAFTGYGPEGDETLVDGRVKLGLCWVTIPKDHQMGVLEGPAFFSLRKEDSKRDVVLQDVKELEQAAFERLIAKAIRKAAGESGPQVLVFIHGYNTSFDDAARRTAQLAFDLKFQGATAFFSWPSKANPLLYTADEASAEAAAIHLKHFLRLLCQKSGAEKVHLIAHSMGNRCLAYALEQMVSEDKIGSPLFDEIVFTAPDVDARLFKQKFALIRGTAKRLTLYASSSDKALMASRLVHDNPRAGESGDRLMMMENLDTIDASTVATDLIGHAYFGDSRTVVSDLFDLIRGVHVNKRSQLRGIEPPMPRYWAFRH